jgi:RNA polymerase sigma factor (sigma-70 family)
MTEPRDDLLVLARTDPRAFATFYRSFERSMLGFFVRQTGRADLAADLAAETFARALEQIERFDPERGRADQWLFGIARHVLADSLRRGRVEASARQRMRMGPLVLDDHAEEAIRRLSAESAPVVAAFAGLPGEQRQAVQARVIEERDYTEIAARMECSEALVRQRVSRGLRALRLRLGAEGQAR